MSDTNPNHPINPERVALKLAEIENFQHPQIKEETETRPRLVEILHFLQWASLADNYAGGLRRFTADLIEASGDLIAPEATRRVGEGPEPRVAEVVEMYRALPEGVSSAIRYRHPWLDAVASIAREEPERKEKRNVHLAYARTMENHEWEERILDEIEEETQERIAWEECINKEIRVAKWSIFQNVFISAAEDNLSVHLRNLCEQPHVSFVDGAPWYFENVAAAILRFMDRRAEALSKTIAETEVTRIICKWLGKARNTKRAIKIEGNSRFGKTESVRLWCKMNVGAARLVNTPASSSEGDLLREVAKALGLDLGPKARGTQLRERIDYLLRHSRLMLIFDEAHLIFPTSFSRNTPPARLNWVRRAVMDSGLPCAFVCTPQSYKSARNRFVKATGFVIEQFEERILKTVELPQELCAEDLLAAARIHFPNLKPIYLEFVVRKVKAKERNLMSDLEKIATLARDNAMECGRELPILEDLKAAIADVMPPAQLHLPTPAPESRKTTAPRSNAAAVQSPRRVNAEGENRAPGRVFHEVELGEELELPPSNGIAFDSEFDAEDAPEAPPSRSESEAEMPVA